MYVSTAAAATWRTHHPHLVLVLLAGGTAGETRLSLQTAPFFQVLIDGLDLVTCSVTFDVLIIIFIDVRLGIPLLWFVQATNS